MDPATLLAFVIVAAVLTVAPGADMALVAHTSLARGHRAAWVTTIGICAGLGVHAIAWSVGLSSLLARSATAYAVVKTAGALYLIVLGVLALRASAKPASAAAPPARASRNLFLTGLASNVLNPKVALFYLTFLPQFVDPAAGNVLAQSLLLALIHFAMGLAWLLFFAVAVERAGKAVGTSSFRAWMQRVTGGLLVLVGAKLLLERGPQRA